jgi:hypothetical protein
VTHTPNIRVVRNLLAGAALIGAMVADFAETLVDPANTSEAGKFFAAAANHHDRMVVSAMLLLASGLLLVPGVLGIARTLRARGKTLGVGGSALALLGGAGHVALAAFYLVFATIPSSDLSRGQAVNLLHHILNSGEAKLLAPLALAFPLAILVTLIGTVRGGLTERWVLAPLVAAPIVAIVGPGSSSVKTSCALVLFLIAAAAVMRPARSISATQQPATA